ncbi:MAG: DNA internalization-related competence protein ComEC/Rec2 [Nitrospirota bacterium]|nr:DNA internalization-related competence protein ComEC/Rec2 [Nitrospirota bacterium]
MLPRVTLAVVVGLVLGSYLPYLPTLSFFLLIVAALTVTAYEGSGRLTATRGVVIYGGLLAGVVAWALASWLMAGSTLVDQAGPEPIRVVGTIVQPIDHAPDRTVLVLTVTQVGEGQTAKVTAGRLRLTWRYPDRTFAQGDRVAFTARLRRPSGTLNPGGFDYGTYLTHQGIHAVASVSGAGRVRVLASAPLLSRWGPWRVIDEWRERIYQAALATLTGPALQIYLGMITGERGYITHALRETFMATGTVHILSISGSHLGMVAFLSFFLVKGLCRVLPAPWLQALSRRITPSRLAAGVTVLPVTFYTLLAGSEVATVRSLVMLLLFLLAVWLGRERDLLLALACAALLILVHDPQALWDISFQLSYLSVLAIALVLRRTGEGQDLPVVADVPSFPSRAKRWLREYLWLTGGVTLATAPLVAYYFNQIAWLGLGANLLIVPLAGFILVPLGLSCAVWLLLTGGDVLPAGPIIQALFDSFFGVVSVLARVPGAEWHVASPSILSMVVFYLMLYLAVRPVHGIRSQWTRRVCCGGALLLLGWWGWSPRALPDGDTVRVAFLDVGQGDACVIELPDGQTVLVDAGANYGRLDMGRAVVGPYLWDRGIRRLDHVIGTHPQLDHVGGLPWILRKFTVGHYWGNGVERDGQFYRRLQEALEEQGLVEQIAGEGQTIIASGPCTLLVLNPPARERVVGEHASVLPMGRSGKALNNQSVVLRLDCGRHSFLLTADIEAAAMARLSESGEIRGVRVLKIPHHGARGSLSEGWLDRVDAEAAVISVGRRNPYGHPAAAVLTAYQNAGVQLFRTDRDGGVWVTARLSSPDLFVRTARASIPQPVRIGPAMLASEVENLARIGNLWNSP